MNHKPTYEALEKKIQELEEAEQKNKQFVEKFRELVEHSNNWVWEVDNNGVYTYSSPQVEMILGYKPEEIIGKHGTSVMPKEEAERVMNIFQKLLKEPDLLTAIENVALHKDGHRVVLETNAAPFFDENGEVAGYRGVDRNITGRKKIEAEKEQLIDDLQRALDEIKTLKGILPFCSFCKKIRNNNNEWVEVDAYIHSHSEADISHSVCPECCKEHYPEAYDDFDSKK